MKETDDGTFEIGSDVGWKSSQEDCQPAFEAAWDREAVCENYRYRKTPHLIVLSGRILDVARVAFYHKSQLSQN